MISALERLQPLDRDYDTALDVKKSALGKHWHLSAVDERAALAICQAYQLPEIVARLLSAREIKVQDVETFLSPTLKQLLPDPYILKDMEKAAERLADAISLNEQVAIFGDYDVDGATSCALFKRFFKMLDRDVRIYVPYRLTEGYGPNTKALMTLKDEGTKVIVTVDCGVSSYEPIAAVKQAGVDVLILDHHRAAPELPNAYACVNPNRLDDESNLGQLAAVGVCFLTIIAVNRLLRARGFYYTSKKPEPQLTDLLDIVALGTICDVVPLTGVNRAFVAQGLKVMALRENVGLKILADVAGVDGKPSTFHAGFLIGPRVNAGGRIGEPALGARLLSCDDEDEARSIAQQLHALNAERRDLEMAVLDQAIAQVEASGDAQSKIIIASGDNWHPGVIGIVAARLKEKYNRPACVISFDEKGLGKASARSVSEIDLGGAILAAREKGLLIDGGGHKMAAGFSIEREKLSAVQHFLNQHLCDQLKGEDYQPRLRIDAVLSVSSLTQELVEKIEQLAPFGTANPEPRFALTGVRIVKPSVVGESHIRCFIQDGAGGSSLKAISFRALNTSLGDLILEAGKPGKGVLVNLAGHVRLNSWMGKSTIDFQIVDASPHF